MFFFLAGAKEALISIMTEHVIAFRFGELYLQAIEKELQKNFFLSNVSPTCPT